MTNETQIPCPQCKSPYPYQDGPLWICPECNYEWSQTAETSGADQETIGIVDANGNALQDGDTVTVIKTLKVKGANNPIKAGTKVKNIRLVPDSPDGHDIFCRIEGFGAMGLKSEFVKKA